MGSAHTVYLCTQGIWCFYGNAKVKLFHVHAPKATTCTPSHLPAEGQPSKLTPTFSFPPPERMSELVLPLESSFMASTLRFLVVTLSSKLASIIDSTTRVHLLQVDATIRRMIKETNIINQLLIKELFI
jgi:hypothetical protein